MKIFFCSRDSLPLVLLFGVAVLAMGCEGLPSGQADSPSDPEEPMESGYVFYLDGAGGGTAKKNWSEVVSGGLKDGGYGGTGEHFTWEKGSGVMANENASLAYKRRRADELAWAIEDQIEAFPGAPIEIVGFSAGGDVALLALTILPPTVRVDNVILLGASLGEDDDLTEALKRVKGSLTLFTSTGCRVPDGADEETGNLYAEKVLTMPWDAATATSGGDSLKREFIRDQVAPFLLAGGSNFLFDMGDEVIGGNEWLFEDE